MQDLCLCPFPPPGPAHSRCPGNILVGGWSCLCFPDSVDWQWLPGALWEPQNHQPRLPVLEWGVGSHSCLSAFSQEQSGQSVFVFDWRTQLLFLRNWLEPFRPHRKVFFFFFFFSFVALRRGILVKALSDLTEQKSILSLLTHFCALVTIMLKEDAFAHSHWGCYSGCGFGAAMLLAICVHKNLGYIKDSPWALVLSLPLRHTCTFL